MAGKRVVAVRLEIASLIKKFIAKKPSLRNYLHKDFFRLLSFENVDHTHPVFPSRFRFSSCLPGVGLPRPGLSRLVRFSRRVEPSLVVILFALAGSSRIRRVGDALGNRSRQCFITSRSLRSDKPDFASWFLKSSLGTRCRPQPNGDNRRRRPLPRIHGQQRSCSAVIFRTGSC